MLVIRALQRATSLLRSEVICWKEIRRKELQRCVHQGLEGNRREGVDGWAGERREGHGVREDTGELRGETKADGRRVGGASPKIAMRDYKAEYEKRKIYFRTYTEKNLEKRKDYQKQYVLERKEGGKETGGRGGKRKHSRNREIGDQLYSGTPGTTKQGGKSIGQNTISRTRQREKRTRLLPTD
jgi:hypothetical protein